MASTHVWGELSKCCVMFGDQKGRKGRKGRNL